jgi:hypothetical protein
MKLVANIHRKVLVEIRSAVSQNKQDADLQSKRCLFSSTGTPRPIPICDHRYREEPEDRILIHREFAGK